LRHSRCFDSHFGGSDHITDGIPASILFINPTQLDGRNPEPITKFFRVHFTFGESHHRQNRVRLRSRQTVAVQLQKNARSRKGRPLVPVNEWMVACRSVGIGGGQDKDIGLAIFEVVDRRGKGRLQKALIP